MGTYTNQSVVVTLTYDEAVTGLTTDTSQFSEATNIASLTLLSVLVTLHIQWTTLVQMDLSS